MLIRRKHWLVLAYLLGWGFLVHAGEVHWAYRVPVRATLPEVRHESWPANHIDHFTLAAMEQRGLTPATEADKRTLIRRVTFDLTGCPPRPEEVEAFLNDSRPDAYLRLVDRLLQSPRFGERMAATWLDLARYADTHGYHMDAHRDMWRWRDWVIEAYNRNLPFDQFTIEQLAGDLLPQATLSQRIATGFNRNNMINFENGVIADEFLVEYAVDRVATTSTVWLGQTLVCARCHDHKYDPFTQREFYQLLAFFNNVPEQGVDGDQGNAQPFIAAPLPHQQAELNRLKTEAAELKHALAARVTSSAEAFAHWMAQAKPGESAPVAPEPAFAFSFDKADAESGHTTQGQIIFVPGKLGQAMLFDGSTYVECAAELGAAADQGCTLCVWVYATTSDRMPIVSLRDATKDYLLQVALADGQIHASVNSGKSRAIAGIASSAPLGLRRWRHVAVRYDGPIAASPLSLYVDGKLVDAPASSELAQTADSTLEGILIGSHEPSASFRGMLDDLRIYDRTLSASNIELVAGGDPLGEILSRGEEERTPEQRAWLREYYLRHVDDEYQRLSEGLHAVEKQRAALEASFPTAMVMQDRANSRPTFILEQGRYDAPGGEVAADVPAILPPLSTDAPRNRLSLAKWLFDSHPLTARVAVNRLWQQCFGTGIVSTSEDFGTRGAPSTHPELLDWLAVEFQRDWDVKRMLRLIVTSSTYRQSSEVSSPMAARDPNNRWLSRAPRWRLDGEMIRDNALAASGLLVEQVGGASVFPYQPAGLWEEISYNPDFTAQVFRQSHGRDLYRRSLYSFWKRSVPLPTLAAFDVPSREICVAQRPRTRTPQQALVLMNDVAFVEAARVLAESSMLRHGRPEAIIDEMFARCVGRPPCQTERQVLLELFADLVVHYRSDMRSAELLTAFGEASVDPRIDRVELAAWTAVANVILSLDEVTHRN